MKKTRNAAKSTPTEFYVVSWAEKDDNNNSLTSGTFMDIYSTARKARNAVKATIVENMKDIIERHYPDAVERFGTDDPKELARLMVVEDTAGYIKTEWETECQYIITKYSTKYIK